MMQTVVSIYGDLTVEVVQARVAAADKIRRSKVRGAVAEHDRTMAQIMHDCEAANWTQEKIAAATGYVSQSAVGKILRFYRFLRHVDKIVSQKSPVGLFVSNMTVNTLARFWGGTQGAEPERFDAVVAAIVTLASPKPQEKPPTSVLVAKTHSEPLQPPVSKSFGGNAPKPEVKSPEPVKPSKPVLKPKQESTSVSSLSVTKPAVKVISGSSVDFLLKYLVNGDWHLVKDASALVSAKKGVSVSEEAVLDAVRKIESSYDYGVYAEIKRIGGIWQFRLVPAGKLVPLGVVMEKLGPILDALNAEGKKTITTASIATVGSLVSELRNTLFELTK